MKKIIYVLVILIPILGSAQQPWYKSSFLDNLWKDVGSEGFSAGQAEDLSLAFNPIDGQPYVAYSDWSTLNDRVTVMKFDGTSWENVGNPNFSGGDASSISLAFNPIDNLPYVSYCDRPHSLKATVMKFNGTNWVTVGNAGFSAGRCEFTSLAISPDGEPYVAYNDYGNSGKATVMKFDGNNWVNVGNPGFSIDWLAYPSLVINPSGVPFLAYQDYGKSLKATVIKFDGNNWVNVGSPGFTDTTAHFISLALSPTGEPYVAYNEENSFTAGFVSVMKFNGTNWVYVGLPNFSDGWGEYTSLAFSASGEPYVAFRDWENSGSTVMRYDGTNWVNVGNAGFSSSDVFYTCIAFSPLGQPYVAYADAGDSNKTTVMKYDSAFSGINSLSKPQIHLFPNPASTQLTVDLQAIASKIKSIEITNIKGVIMLESTTSKNEIVIDVTDLSAGIYFVKIKTGNTNFIRKFCKD